MTQHRFPLRAWALASLLPLAATAQAAAGDTTTVTAGHARFQFLTPSLVRMEYEPSGVFVDAPTAVVLKRNWPAVAVRTTRRHGWLTVTTADLTLRYRLHSGRFAADNLAVTWHAAAGRVHAWHPGQTDPLNLGGLTYSLDNVGKANLPGGHRDLESPVHDIIPGIDVHLAEALPGLLSRSGYAFIDDSRTPVWNARHSWIEPRPHMHGQDDYLFVYGRDYRQVLREYAELCGPVPMIPRYTLRPWITDLNFEYFPDTVEARQPAFLHYGQQHLEREIARLRRDRIPFGTLVLDFAWHNYGWQGGYDWSPLIPHPRQFMDWLHARGIRLSLNDHPGYANTDESILSYSDSHAPAVLKALGRPLPPKPSIELDIAAGWRFAVDPHDVGLARQWYAPGHGGDWKPIRSGLSWQAQGYPDYHGIAWYRTSVKLPAELPKALYVELGQVGGLYRIFVNGHEVRHSTPHWPRRLSYADIAPYARPGRPNDIALRVDGGGSGDDTGNSTADGLLRGPLAIRDVLPPKRIFFDLSNRHQADVFMRLLHLPLMRAGVAAWWVDGGGGAATMPGLNPQLWTNRVFYDFTPQETGKRGFILSRYGNWGSERYPAFFTGDTYSEWPVLAYEVAFTARGGNVLVPYISNDIAGFHGAKIAFDLYARWIEFGAFSPILRMHSAHANPYEGNVRMPWVYGDKGVALMRKYFTLRTRLIPYIYTYAWRAHTASMPILRPLYLEYPDLHEAYRHTHEYFFGREMLVAPVLDPGGERTVYLPPGRWIDFFTGQRYAGGTTFTAHYATDRTPVFVRDGAIVPEQPVRARSDAGPPGTLILNVYGNAPGHFDLYEDDGDSLAYEHGQYATTPMRYLTATDGLHRLVIGPTRGTFARQMRERAYQVRIHAHARPRSIHVDGQVVSGWRWDAARSIAVVAVPRQAIRDRVEVDWQ